MKKPERPARVRRTCLPAVVREGGAESENRKVQHFFQILFLKGVFVLLLHAVFIGPVAQRIEQQSSKL